LGRPSDTLSLLRAGSGAQRRRNDCVCYFNEEGDANEEAAN